ncbi:MAG: hypothetical protein LBT62_05675 [Deltaproteobacteria bacterium]|nr:hypothetical protein [Deltaproteobacteria bacterium]
MEIAIIQESVKIKRNPEFGKRHSKSSSAGSPESSSLWRFRPDYPADALALQEARVDSELDCRLPITDYKALLCRLA